MASTTRASEHSSHCEVQQGGSELISKTSLAIEFIGTIWNWMEFGTYSTIFFGTYSPQPHIHLAFHWCLAWQGCLAYACHISMPPPEGDYHQSMMMRTQQAWIKRHGFAMPCPGFAKHDPFLSIFCSCFGQASTGTTTTVTTSSFTFTTSFTVTTTTSTTYTGKGSCGIGVYGLDDEAVLWSHWLELQSHRNNCPSNAQCGMQSTLVLHLFNSF